MLKPVLFVPRQGDYDGARVLYDRALEDMKEAVGENSSLYATLLNNYGMMLEEEV